MRISDWSSDVCSSDLFLLDLLVDGCNRFAHLLHAFGRCHIHLHAMLLKGGKCFVGFLARILALVIAAGCGGLHQYVFFSRAQADRKSVVSGKRVAVRVDLGGRRIIKKKKEKKK